MATSILPGFVKRSEASKKYKVDFRNFGRDLSQALALRDDNFLGHLKLWTKDGEVREGTEVTPDLVIDLRQKGMVPTWYVEIEFLKTQYKRRRESQESEQPDDAQPVDAEGPKYIDAEIVDDDDTDENASAKQADDAMLALMERPLINKQMQIIATQKQRIEELENDRKLLSDAIQAMTRDANERHPEPEQPQSKPKKAGDRPTTAKYLPTFHRLIKGATRGTLNLASKKVW